MKTDVVIDKTAKIWQPTTILEHERYIRIGRNCRIGQHCFIAPRKFVMEDGAEISPNVTVGGGGVVYMCKYSTVDYGARLIPATFTTEGKYMNDTVDDEALVDIVRGSITLEEGAVIASNAVVTVSKRCKDVVIGKNSVIGALTFIDSSVPPDTIVRNAKFHVTEKR